MTPDTVFVSAQAVAQSTSDTFWIELVKCALFSVFVSALLEVFKETFKRFNPDGLDSQTVKILNFVLALSMCYVFDYGLMMRVIQGGVKLRGSVAPYLDYLATAAVIYKGADWVFDKFSAMKAKLVATRASYENGNAKVVKTSSQVSSSSVETVKVNS
jgi:hypothetical protein